MMINVDVNVELIDKAVCDKGYIWNPSNCECECDKSCDAGEYLDYKNCQCRKKIADKLVEECTETVEELKIVSENKKKMQFLRIVHCHRKTLVFTTLDILQLKKLMIVKVFTM